MITGPDDETDQEEEQEEKEEQEPTTESGSKTTATVPAPSMKEVVQELQTKNRELNERIDELEDQADELEELTETVEKVRRDIAGLYAGAETLDDGRHVVFSSSESAWAPESVDPMDPFEEFGTDS